MMHGVNIGDKVMLPVHMDRGPERMRGVVVGLYKRFYRVKFDMPIGKPCYESYNYFGGQN